MSSSRPVVRAARPTLRASLLRASWFGCGAGLLRVALVLVMDLLGQGRSGALAAYRLEAALPAIVLRAVLVACAASLALILAAGEERRPAPSRRPWLWPLLALGTTLFVAGWLEADPSHRVGWQTSRGRLVLVAVATCCAALVGGLALLSRRPSAPRRAPLVAFLLPLTLFVLPPWIVVRGLSGDRRPMQVRAVLHEVLAAPAPWSVLRAVHPPRVDLLCPSTSYALAGADMRSLVLPPPAEVRLAPLPLDGPATLRARVGMDHAVFDDPRWRGHVVRFEVLRDGASLFEARIPIEPLGPWPGSEWVSVGGDGGLPVEPGVELVLRTSLWSPDGEEVVPDAELPVGFGGLTCERSVPVPRTRSSPEHPNVLLIVMDTERADRLSAYGYGRPTTPHLERLAARGRLFERAYATGSWTWPSTASLLTGLLPQEHGVESYTSCTLAEGLDTLPEVLQRAGYTTAAWSANPLIVPDKNFHQGFETFERGGDSPRRTDTFLPVVREWLRQQAGTRFFLYLQLMDVHTPRRPLPEGRARFAAHVPSAFDGEDFLDLEKALLRNAGHEADGTRATDRVVSAEERGWHGDLYDACVWTGDHWLGLLLDDLEALGLLDETLVVYTSDHGEELFERGLAGHGHTLYPELVRVPLVVAGPGVPRGERIGVPVSNRHLAPSLARLAGAAPIGAPDAQDLLGPAEGLVPGPVFFATTQGWWEGRRLLPLVGLRRGAWVLHHAPTGAPWGAAPAPGGDWRLFDLATDPRLTIDRATDRAELAEELRTLLDEELRAAAARRTSPAVGAGDATLEMLRGIGYLGD